MIPTRAPLWYLLHTNARVVPPSKIKEVLHKMNHANGSFPVSLTQPHLKEEGDAVGLVVGVSVQVPYPGTCGVGSKASSSASTFLPGSNWGLHRRKKLPVPPPTLSLNERCSWFGRNLVTLIIALCKQIIHPKQPLTTSEWYIYL